MMWKNVTLLNTREILLFLIIISEMGEEVGRQFGEWAQGIRERGDRRGEWEDRRDGSGLKEVRRRYYREGK